MAENKMAVLFLSREAYLEPALDFDFLRSLYFLEMSWVYIFLFSFYYDDG